MFGLTSSLAALLLSATTGGVGLPFGVPPTPEDPVLARALPEQCLFCLSWAGTASPDPNSTNQTEQLLAEPEVQEFLSAAGRNVHSYLTLLNLMLAYASAVDSKSSEKDAVASPIPEALLRSLATHSGMIFVSKVSCAQGEGRQQRHRRWHGVLAW